MIKYFNVEAIIQLHDALIDQFGGLKGIRDINLLCSALEVPKSSLFGHEFYPSLYDKAAAYLYHIIQNHPFNDGNKRTGSAAAYLFLEINKSPIVFDDDDYGYEELILEVAQNKRNKEEISYFFQYGKLPVGLK